jgi:hypothetical protein
MIQANPIISRPGSSEIEANNYNYSRYRVTCPACPLEKRVKLKLHL